MKVRSDFVTNSSSSSFICAFKDREDLNTQLDNLSSINGEYANIIRKDIKDKSHHLNKKKVLHLLREAYQVSTEMELFWGDNYHNWSQRLQEEGLKSWEVEKLPEYHDLVLERVEEKMAQAEKKLEEYTVFSEVEYGDDTEFWAQLEHYIMPSLPFVFEIISHH